MDVFSLLIVSKKGNTHTHTHTALWDLTSWLIQLTGFWIFNYLWHISLRSLNLSPAKRTLSYLAKNPSTTSYKWFAIIISPFPQRFRTFFFKLMTVHAFCLAHAHCAGDTYSVPHVCLDRTDYTCKFAFYYNIITSHVSSSYFMTSSLISILPTSSEGFRRYPTLVLTYFRFPIQWNLINFRKTLSTNQKAGKTIQLICITMCAI